MNPGSRAGLAIDIYGDGTNVEEVLAAYRRGVLDGVTTNPTLMSQAGVRDYRTFARELLAAVPDVPVSFQVLADDIEEMGGQARQIAGWAENVYVKVPITTTRGETTVPLLGELSAEAIKVNATAVMTPAQAAAVAEAVSADTPSIVSVFAGRIADSGRDPVPLMREAVARCRGRPRLKVLWASPREILNVYQAEACGCHVIALTPSLLCKLELRDKDLLEFSRETVQMFHDDGLRAGYRL